MSTLLTTKEAGRLCGVHAYRLQQLISVEKLPPPKKNSTGHYVWSAADVERAKKVLAKARKPPQGVLS